MSPDVIESIFHLIFAAALGAVIGSFVNLVIHRLPLMLEHTWQRQLHEATNQPFDQPPPPNLSHPRSHCPQCLAQLAWWQNIPVVSWLLLRGRCHHCHVAVPARYLWVEVSLSLWFVWCVHHYGATEPVTWFWCLWGAWLLCAATIDWKTYLLPDSLTLHLLWLTLLMSALGVLPIDASSSILGAILGYGMLAVPGLLFERLTGRVGMANGDFKLMAAVGAALGPEQIPWVLLMASTTGVALAVLAKRWIPKPSDVGASDVYEQAIPFGPAIALAAVIALVIDFHWLELQF